MNEIRERLREARLNAGFSSASKAACALGVGVSTYAAHENGQNGFDVDAAAKYARKFNVSVEWLLTGGHRMRGDGTGSVNHISANAPSMNWRGGDSDYEQVSESDLTLPMLRILADSPDGFISTTDLIDALAKLFKPSGKDAEIIEGRADTHFSQKVRNIISHRYEARSPVQKGWVVYHVERKGLEITAAGRFILATF